MKMMNNKSRIIISDGWHPTINPSSRMPIHHHRFVDLLECHNGVLNELPRQFGGNTLRAMQIDKEGNINVTDLNKACKYMPWWISGNSSRAIDLIRNIITEAQRNPKCLSAYSYERLLDCYLEFATENPEYTFGEVLFHANNRLYKEVYPNLPDVNLISLSRDARSRLLADGLSVLANDIISIFNEICHISEKKELGFLGVITDMEGMEYRLTYAVKSNLLQAVTLYKPYSSMNIEINKVIELLRAGSLLPSSQLLIAIEFALAKLGFDVVHFGNAYERHILFAEASGLENKVTYWNDNIDSWNFIMLKGNNGVVYPLHLMELLSVEDRVKELIPSLIKKSLDIGEPLLVRIKKGGNLYEALSD